MAGLKQMYNAAIEKELIEVGARWALAMVTNDADAIGVFMDDDWIIVSERGIATKRQFLSFVESGQLTHSLFEMSGDARTRIYGDTAVLTCRVTNTAHFGGQELDADEWTSDVFVKKDGNWLCVLSHITPVDKNWPVNN
ncbi:MAG: nuclear transport factor 2 family protein [Pyrinomonadaceae bacterium]